MHATLPLLGNTFPELRRTRLETLQVNLGYRCNQTCLHCHVHAGPTRTEAMSRETIDLVLRYLAASGARARGEGVYEKSIAAIRALNSLGYGREGTGLTLDLVYNPQGPALPPPQAK